MAASAARERAARIEARSSGAALGCGTWDTVYDEITRQERLRSELAIAYGRALSECGDTAQVISALRGSDDQ